MNNRDKRDHDSPQSPRDPQDEIEMRKLSGQGKPENGRLHEDIDESRTGLEKTREDAEWQDPGIGKYLKGRLANGGEGDSASDHSGRVGLHNQGPAQERREGPPGTGQNLEYK